MPAFQDQQAIQQLLSGLNTMQMQAGLMPGGVPAINPGNQVTPQPVMTPGQFSNNLMLQLRQNTYSPVPLQPPMYGAISPVPRNDYAQAVLPPPNMGSGWGMARQNTQASTSSWMTNAQTVAGFGGRTGMGIAGGMLGRAVGGRLIGGALGGPVGAIAGGLIADSFLGEGIERMMSAPIQPFIDQRQRALQLQNTSLGFVNRGFDVSASGSGLTTTASMDLERRLSRMSDSRQFKFDTNNSFNRQDMMKLTHLSGQMGLLDSSQSVDQISRDMGKISRALHTFMKVVEEPDVQQALMMMGKMKKLGMTIPETNVAAGNARTFARMAGTTVQSVIQAGMQGADVFQSMGMSGATGMNVGMAATGNAGLLGSLLDPRQKAMLGGREGIAQSLMTSSAKMSQLDVLLPGLLKAGKGGLSIDKDAMLELAQGKRDITGLVQESARRMAGFGPQGFVNEYSTRKSELKDEMMNSLGGQGAMLMPMLMARNIMQKNGVDFRGALGLMNLDEKESRTIELAYRNPEFWQGIRQQQQTQALHQQTATAAKRQQIEGASGDAAWRKAGTTAGNVLLRGLVPTVPGMPGISVGGLQRMGKSIGNSMDNFFSENFGEDSDLDEQVSAYGGGALIRTIRESRLGSADSQRQLRERVSTNEGARGVAGTFSDVQRRLSNRIRGEDRTSAHMDRLRHVNGVMGVMSNVSDMFVGPDGFGVTATGTGGEFLRETVMRNEGLNRRIGNFFGLGDSRSIKDVDRRADSMMQTGDLIESARASRFDTNRTKAMFEKSGLTGTAFDQAMGTASAVFTKYAEDQGNMFGGQSGDFSMAQAKNQIRTALKGKVNEQQLNALMKNPDFMKEVIAMGEGNRSEQANAVLENQVKAGADVAGGLTGRTRSNLRTLTDEHRKKALDTLGVYGDTASASEKKALIGIFGETGKTGEIRQKLMTVKALHAAGKHEQAEQLRAEINRMGTPEEIEKASAAVEGAASNLDKTTLEDMGKKFGKYFNDREKVFSQARQEAGAAQNTEAFEGVTQRLGVKGAEMFAKHGMQGLRDYAKAGGKLGSMSKAQAARLVSGEMTEEDLVKDSVGSLTGRADAVVGGGLSQQAGAATDEVTDQIVTTLEEAAKRDNERMEKTYGSFDKSVSKFSEATEALSAAATALADGKAVADLGGEMDKSKNSSWW